MMVRACAIPLLILHASTQAQGFNVPLSGNRFDLQATISSSSWGVGRGGALAATPTNSDDSTDPVDVDVVSSSFSDLAAQNAKQMSNSAMDTDSRSQQSKSYLLCTALWMSLALDTVLNKKKRALLGLGSDIGGKLAMGNIAPTANLASGFILSAGLALFLSRDLNRSEVGSWEDELKAEAMRKKLHLLLCFNGLTNLFGNINPASVPFFGIGGFVINAHNSLLALNGWIKESSSPTASLSSGNNVKADDDAGMKDFFGTLKSIFASTLKTADASLGFATRMLSSLYMAAALIAGLRSVDIITNSLFPHYKSCYALKSVSWLLSCYLRSVVPYHHRMLFLAQYLFSFSIWNIVFSSTNRTAANDRVKLGCSI